MEHYDEMMGQEEVEVRWVGDLRKDEMLVSWDGEQTEEEQGVLWIEDLIEQEEMEGGNLFVMWKVWRKRKEWRFSWKKMTFG